MHDVGCSEGVTAAIFDDCYHLGRDLAKVEYEYVPREVFMTKFGA